MSTGRVYPWVELLYVATAFLSVQKIKMTSYWGKRSKTWQPYIAPHTASKLPAPDGFPAMLPRLCAVSAPCLCHFCADSLKSWYRHVT
jgi:hypothetical protein